MSTIGVKKIQYPDGDTILTLDSSGGLGIGNATTGDITNEGTANRQYVTIQGQGNRGRLNLGTTSLAGADAGTLAFTNGSNTIASLSADTVSGSTTNGTLGFATSGSTRMTLDSAGSLGINTTNPAGKLEVVNTSVNYARLGTSNKGHYFESQSDNNTDGFEIYQQHGSNTTRNSFIINDNRTGSKSAALVVRGDGHVGINTSAGSNSLLNIDGGIEMSAPSGVYTNIMENGTAGFYGDFGFGPIFRTPDLNAGSSGESTSDFMDLYQSGHWGQGHSIFVWVINRYYGSGYRKYHIRYDRNATNPTITQIEAYGGEIGSYIDYHNSTNIGSNGHGNLQVRRTTIRLRTGGAYYNCFAWIQLIRTTDGNYCHDNASTQSNVATQRATAGGTVHFRTFSINHAGAVYPRRRTA